MKQKSQNRFLAALLAVAMMLQMLPMLAFAEDAPDAYAVKIDGKEGSYAKLVDAVKAASSGDTIILGEGNYTLYGIKSDDTTKGKNLTFVGQGPDKTAWNIGDKVPDPSKYGTEYNGDYSFDGAGTVTFKNMTLRSGDGGLSGLHPCRIILWWITASSTARPTTGAMTSAVFKDTTFNAPSSRLCDSGRIVPRP